MIINKRINTKNLYLENINLDKISNNYVNWLLNLENTKFTQIQNINYEIKSVKDYIKKINESDYSLIFGIFYKRNKFHIGNIKIEINRNNLTAELGILLGENKYQGKSLGTEAIKAFTSFVFEELKLFKLKALIYENNQASLKSFKKAGWKLDSILKNEFNFFGARKNCINFFIFNKNHFKPFKFSKSIKNITFIGGGDIMLQAIKIAHNKNINSNVILSSRHAYEKLPISNKILINELKQLKIKTTLIDNINSNSFLKKFKHFQSIALCFGPAWIFSNKIINKFHFGMFNFNGIPIPNYLGGAHYTWQILNDNKDGGCFIQRISNKIDKGEILSSYNYKLSNKAKIPIDYFKENLFLSSYFLSNFFDQIINKETFYSYSYETYKEKTKYYPRLNSNVNSWVDWKMKAEEIVKFCNAFDSPYSGAITTHKSQIIKLKSVSIIEKENFHTFTCGIILRTYKNSIFVAVKNGVLQINKVFDIENRDYIKKIKKGDRLLTKNSKIDQAKSHKPVLDSKGFSK